MKLARILYEENPLLWSHVDHVRSALRSIEGKIGDEKKARIRLTAPKKYQEASRPLNPYKLPESSETSYEPYIVPGKRVLVLSDIHIPYHSIDALTAALDF